MNPPKLSNSPTQFDEATLKIRKADIQDASRLYDVLQQGYRGSSGWIRWDQCVTGERISLQELEALITEGSDMIFVACVDQTDEHSSREPEIAGCISVQSAPELPQGHATIGLFSVDPAFQSKGIGKVLLRYATDFLTAQWMYKRIVIYVLDRHEILMAWYVKNGFRETGERIPYFYPDHALVPDLHFSVLSKDL